MCYINLPSGNYRRCLNLVTKVESFDPAILYKEQLEMYSTAYRKHQKGEEYDIDMDINSHAILYPIYDTLGYAFIDFADDGIPELVIGAIEGEAYCAWDMFAYNGTSVFRVNEMGNYRDEEFLLLEGNYIKECVYSPVVEEVKVYRLEKDTSEKVMVYYVYNGDNY